MPAPSTVLGTSHSWVSVCAQPWFGILLRLSFFPSLFLAVLRVTNNHRFSFRSIHRAWWSWARAWAQGTLQSSREPEWVSRMLLGESGCGGNKGGRKQKILAEQVGLRLVWEKRQGWAGPLGSRRIQRPAAWGAELERGRGSKGIPSKKWVCQTSYWVGGWHTLQRF